MKETNICNSKKEARRLINAGSVKINGLICEDDTTILNKYKPIDDIAYVLTVGKKKMHLLHKNYK